MRFGGAVEVAERRAGSDLDLSHVGVDDHVRQPAEVEDDAALDGAVPRDVVTAPADRQREAEALRRRDGPRDVPDPACPDDGGRTPVDHRVPDRSCLVVPRVGRFDDRALDRRPKRLQRSHAPSSLPV